MVEKYFIINHLCVSNWIIPCKYKTDKRSYRYGVDQVLRYVTIVMHMHFGALLVIHSILKSASRY